MYIDKYSFFSDFDDTFLDNCDYMVNPDTILVVDDDADIRKILCFTLKSAGYNVLESATGNRCLEIVATNHPTLILLDVILPDINGFEVCRQIKDNPATADISIFFLSAFKSSTIDISEGLDIGADGYMVKPVDHLELLARVHAIMRLKQAEEQIIRAKKEWERTFDAVPDCIALIDKNYRITRVNRAMAERLGYLPQDIVGKTCYKEIHNTLEAPDFCPHSKLLRDSQEHTAEVHEEILGGDFLVTVTPLFDLDGNLTGCVHVARDITDRKLAEEALKKSHSNLEVRISQRTRELSETVARLKNEIEKRINIEKSLHDQLAFEQVLSRLSSNFINVTPLGIESIIQQNIRDVVTFLDVDRGTLFEMNEDECSLRSTYSFTSKDYQPAPQHLSFERFPWMLSKVMYKQIAFFSSLDDVPYGSGFEHDYLIKEGIKSAVAVPLLAGDALLGILAFASIRCNKTWSDELIKRLQLMGEIIANALMLKKAERDLRKKEESLAEAQRIAHLGSWDWNIVANELHWSDEVFRIFGLAPQQFGATYDAFLESVHEDDRKSIIQAVDSSLTNPYYHYSIEHRVVRPDGSIRFVHERGEVTFDNKKPVRMIGTVHDITERKLAENELQRHRDELAHSSRVNTMGVLSASFAHELNQPLTVILTNAQAAQRLLRVRKPNLDEIGAALEDIIEAVRRASEVLRHIRSLMKKGELEQAVLNINDVIHEIIALVYSEVVANGVEIHSVLMDNPPPVMADRIQIQQVLLNLILNGIESMSGESQSERILIISSSQSNDSLIVSVRDRGHGIRPSDFEKIFTPFFTSKTDGLGMGLSINRSIIQAHGGKIWAENNHDKGAAFLFSLPVHKEVT